MYKFHFSLRLIIIQSQKRLINNGDVIVTVKYIHDIFFFSVLLNRTGMRERTAMRVRIRMDCIDTCPDAVVSSYRVVPARIKKKEGGATPVRGGVRRG